MTATRSPTYSAPIVDSVRARAPEGLSLKHDFTAEVQRAVTEVPVALIEFTEYLRRPATGVALLECYDMVSYLTLREGHPTALLVDCTLGGVPLLAGDVVQMNGQGTVRLTRRKV